ncbi:Cyclic nucleotide-binding domain-containing protein 2 [Paramecium bursaria]
MQFLLQKPPQHRTKQEIDQLVEMTSDLPFFKTLLQKDNGQYIHRQCCKFITLEIQAAHQIVFHIDSVGDKFYIILNGEVSVIIRKQDTNQFEIVRNLFQGEAFGELALINKKPRMATIQCVTDCCFAVLTKQHFKSILMDDQRQQLQKKIDFFQSIPLFQLIHPNNLKQLYLNSFLYEYHKNQVIVKEGEIPNALYLIKQGQFVYRKVIDNKKIDIVISSERELLGLVECARKQKYTYSIVCQSQEGYCYRITRNAQLEKIILHSDINLDQISKVQQQIINSQLEKVQKTFCFYSNFLRKSIKTEVSSEQFLDISDKPIKKHTTEHYRHKMPIKSYLQITIQKLEGKELKESHIKDQKDLEIKRSLIQTPRQMTAIQMIRSRIKNAQSPSERELRSSTIRSSTPNDTGRIRKGNSRLGQSGYKFERVTIKREPKLFQSLSPIVTPLRLSRK